MTKFTEITEVTLNQLQLYIICRAMMIRKHLVDQYCQLELSTQFQFGV